jgi:hypothetical protein
VLQVLAAYLVGTWLAPQVADVAVLPALGIAGVGTLPVMGRRRWIAIAFILSWRYEFSSQGIRRHESAPVRTHRPRRYARLIAGQSLRWWYPPLVAAAAIVQLASLAGRVGTEIHRQAPSVAAPVRRPAIRQPERRPQLDYWRGTGGELINRLSTVSSCA